MDDPQVTRRALLGGVGAAAVAVGLSACGSGSRPAPTPAPAPSPAPTSATPHATATLNEAALRKKVASLLVVGFRGQTVKPGDWIVRAIREQGLGGVILFDRDQLTGARRNITSPAQVTALVRSLRASAPGPLIVSIDQEGGLISRLSPSNGFPATKSQAQIGAVNQIATTHAWAQGMVRSMTSIGVNFNFTPVVDLNVNPSNPAIGKLGRSFSAKPDVVVSCAGEEIRVHRAGGVRTVLKHFPGLGSATANTDFDVVDVSRTWRPIELQPYQKLISARLVDCIMAGHVLNHQLDPSRPASLSKAVVTGLLRTKMGWNGPVVSDDMQAVAITSRYGRAQATTLAVEAGVDMLVFGNQAVYDPNIVKETVDTIVGLVRSGKVSEAQIDKSVARVDTLRPRK